jgi:hypothetical protein
MHVLGITDMSRMIVCCLMITQQRNGPLLLYLAERLASSDPTAAAQQLLTQLETYCSAEFTTTLAQDEALQERVLMQTSAAGAAQVDERFWFALVYRMHRKREHSTAIAVLQRYLHARE